MVTNLMIMEKEYDWDHMPDEELTSIENNIKKRSRRTSGIYKIIRSGYCNSSNEIGMGVVPAYALGDILEIYAEE